MVGFYLKTPGVLGFGLASRDGSFVVAVGSNVRNGQAGNLSVYRKKAFRLREELLSRGIISKGLIFIKPYKFDNISDATSVILGQSRSGNYWKNAAGVSYPEWFYPDKPKRQRPIFKKGSRFTTNSNERFLVLDVVSNRDEDNKEIYEYYLRPQSGGENILIPEHEVVRSLKRLIRSTVRKQGKGLSF